MGPKPWKDIVTNCDATGVNPAGIKCLEAVFANLVSSIVLLIPIALFVMLTIGGFKWLTSAGDAKKVESARNTIMWAIIGIVIIILSYIILKTIEWFTGVPVTIFKIPTFEP